jgi:hypothetical protein
VAPGEQSVTLAQRAHIVGVGRQGPRSRETPLSDDIDAVENLTLFCGEHHRIVDANPRIYSVEVLAKYKADHEARMAPKSLRPAPPPLEADTVDLSLLPVSELPDTIWRATSLFRTAEEVGEHLPRPRGDQILPFVLLKGEVWAFHDLSDTRGPFKQAVDPGTAERLGAARQLKTDDRNIYVWLLNGALRQALLRRGVRLDRSHNRYYFLPDHETITRRVEAQTKTGRAVGEEGGPAGGRAHRSPARYLVAPSGTAPVRAVRARLVGPDDPAGVPPDQGRPSPARAVAGRA